MRTLGLDLGSNSIGWAIVDETKKDNRIEATGVYIFQQGVSVEKNIEHSRAAERREHRSARRLKFRRRLRKYETLKVLIQNKMCPLSVENLDKWVKYEKGSKKEFPKQKEFLDWLKTDENQNKNPYYFRKKAAEGKINLLDLGRALYHIAQRRGFKSNRKDKLEVDELNEIKLDLLKLYENDKLSEDQKIKMIISDCSQESDASNINRLYNNLKGILSDKSKSLSDIYNLIKIKKDQGDIASSIKNISDILKNEKTLGQFFYEQIKEGKRVRGQYTSREEHYLKEFEKICEVQKIGDKLKKDLYNAIFYQRPLKSQKHLVGKCTFEPTKAKCPITHPDFEEFRMYQFINTIKYKNSDGKMVFLSEQERNKIIPLFFRIKRNFEFLDIKKELFGKNCDVEFNYKDYSTVTSCYISSKLRQIFGDDYKNFSKKYKDSRNREKSVDIYDLWHIIFSFDDDDKIFEYAKNNLDLDDTDARKFVKIPIAQGYSSLSLKAIKNILPFLKMGYIYSTAVFLAKIPEIVGKKNWDKDKERIQEFIKMLPENVEKENFNKMIADKIFAELLNENSNICPDKFNDRKRLENSIEEFVGKTKWKNREEGLKHNIIFNINNLINEKLKNNIAKEKMSRIDSGISRFIYDYYKINEEIVLEKLYHPSDIEVYKKSIPGADGKRYLGSPRIDSVKNPMAMRALFQMRKLLNYLIEKGAIDNNTLVRVEMASELNDSNTRAAIEWYNRDREKEHQEYSKKIQEMGFANPSKEDVLKYRLWQEQEGVCLYTGKQINFSDIFGQSPKFDIEHTIPRSLCFDDSQANKTLCCLNFNRNVKQQLLPTQLQNYEEILIRVDKYYKEKIDNLKIQINKLKPSGVYEDVNKKNNRIQKKRKSEIELNYYQNKYKKFILADVPEGFINSQLNDTRIITKYGLAYLKTVFDKVYAVKGETTALFRKMWGVQSPTEKKDRKEHNHHAKDAIVIACSTKGKYDLLARTVRERGKSYKNFISKPWDSFATDVENETKNIFVKYYVPDNIGKETKKVLKKRGKIQYNKDGKKIYLQGTTSRGCLHQDTFYGRIYDPETKELTCVIRKPVSKETVKDEKEINKIIDSKIRKLFLQKYKEVGTDGIIKEGVFLQPRNKTKQATQIKKIRIKAQIKNPIILKKQTFVSEKIYKQDYLVQNDSNYLVVIYKGLDKDDKEISDFECINLLDVSNRRRSGESVYSKTKNKKGVDLNLYQVIKNGDMVLLYENSPDELKNLNKKSLWNRYYKVCILANSGGAIYIKLKNAFTSEVWSYEPCKKDLNEYQKFKYFCYNQIKCLVENSDFIVKPDGKIEFIK